MNYFRLKKINLCYDFQYVVCSVDIVYSVSYSGVEGGGRVR